MLSGTLLRETFTSSTLDKHRPSVIGARQPLSGFELAVFHAHDFHAVKAIDPTLD
jgi:hypothetical protein